MKGNNSFVSQPSKVSNSAFEKSSILNPLITRINKELENFHPCLISAAYMTYSSEEIDQLIKLILAKYVNSIITVNWNSISVDKTFWIWSNDYHIDFSSYYGEFNSKDADLNSLDFSEFMKSFGRHVKSDLTKFLNSALNELNDALNSSISFYLKDFDIKNFKFDGSLQVQVTFTVTLM